MDGILSNSFLCKIFHIIIRPFSKAHSISTPNSYSGLDGLEVEESEVKIWCLRTSSFLVGAEQDNFFK